MVERRATLGIIAHLILIVGVLVVAFPVYVTFVASTHTADEVVQVPMPLLPGSHLIENYVSALQGGSTGAGSTAAVGRMMFVSLVTALVIAMDTPVYARPSARAPKKYRAPVTPRSVGRRLTGRSARAYSSIMRPV